MSVVIISECKTGVLHVKSFLQQMEMKKVWHYETVTEAKLNLSEEKISNVDIILFDADCTSKNRDAVYSDIVMLREWLQVPIMLITSYDTRETIGGAFFAGIFDFMLKPVDFSYFKARIHIALQYNAESRRRRAQEYSLQQDLLVAKNVQKNALSAPLQLDWIQIDGFNRMSYTLGGDMYYWTQVSDDAVAVVLYDVMGHGVASALVSMSIRSILREIMVHSSDPVRVVTELNRHIYELFEAEQLDSFLVTAIYVLIDRVHGVVEYVNAAHPTGFFFNEETQCELAANTPILGLLPNITVHKQRLNFFGKTRLILYTDGLNIGSNQVKHAYFSPYVSNDNPTDLQQLVQDYSLTERAIEDDISFVFMTM